jgi:hypothetical protein
VRVVPKETAFDYKVVYPTPRGKIQVAYADGTFEVAAPEAVTVIRGE